MNGWGVISNSGGYETNWLPTPADGFRMTPRFYGPKYPLINGSYNMPKVIKVN